MFTQPVKPRPHWMPSVDRKRVRWGGVALWLPSRKASKKSSFKSGRQFVRRRSGAAAQMAGRAQAGQRSAVRYEDVMLGSLGRLADHVVLSKDDDAHAHRFPQRPLRAAMARRPSVWDIPLDVRCRRTARMRSSEAGGERAWRNGRPHLAAAHCVRDGLVQIYDVLALPVAVALGRHAWSASMSTSAAPSTICSMRSSPRPTTASCRWRQSAMPHGQPFDFQIVHLNRGAARLLQAAAGRTAVAPPERRRRMRLCSAEVIQAAAAVVNGGRERTVRSDRSATAR